MNTTQDAGCLGCRSPLPLSSLQLQHSVMLSMCCQALDCNAATTPTLMLGLYHSAGAARGGCDVFQQAFRLPSLQSRIPSCVRDAAVRGGDCEEDLRHSLRDAGQHRDPISSVPAVTDSRDCPPSWRSWFCSLSPCLVFSKSFLHPCHSSQLPSVDQEQLSCTC